MAWEYPPSFTTGEVRQEEKGPRGEVFEPPAIVKVFRILSQDWFFSVWSRPSIPLLMVRVEVFKVFPGTGFSSVPWRSTSSWDSVQQRFAEQIIKIFPSTGFNVTLRSRSSSRSLLIGF